jgi:hypothetical protein
VAMASSGERRLSARCQDHFPHVPAMEPLAAAFV